MTTFTSPVTGTAQTGFTSPTYTIAADTAPSALGRQWAVTALGGTQASVRTHTGSDPFTLTIERPSVFRTPGVVQAGATLGSVPRNKYVFRVRKGVVPVVGQAAQFANFELTISLPAGSDAADPANIRAALSLLFGAASQQSAAFGDTLVTGVL